MVLGQAVCAEISKELTANVVLLEAQVPKAGSFSRSERMAKWNEGLRLAEALGQVGGLLPPRQGCPWGRN